MRTMHRPWSIPGCRAHRPVRVVMALLMLVAWSPAWCCCGIRSSLESSLEWAGRSSAVGVASNGPGTGCPHCAVADDRAPTLESPRHAGCDRAPDAPCRCHDQGREALAKVDQGVGAIDLLSRCMASIVPSPATAVAAPAPSVTRGVLGRADGGRAARRSRSLLAQRCMLTI